MILPNECHCQLFAVIHRILILASTTALRGRTLHPTTGTGRPRDPATTPLQVRVVQATTTEEGTDIEGMSKSSGYHILEGSENFHVKVRSALAVYFQGEEIQDQLMS